MFSQENNDNDLLWSVEAAQDEKNKSSTISALFKFALHTLFVYKILAVNLIFIALSCFYTSYYCLCHSKNLWKRQKAYYNVSLIRC